jgi:hypothetical protein
MTLRAYRIYYVTLESMIVRYQDEMQKAVRAAEPKILASFGHDVTLKIVLIDLGATLNHIGEKYLTIAANLGFERCLMDLQLAGKITDYGVPVVAPAKISAQAIQENRSYIEDSLVPAMADKMAGSADLVSSLATFESRINLYGHYLWKTSERSYILGLRMFQAARKEARSRR